MQARKRPLVMPWRLTLTAIAIAGAAALLHLIDLPPFLDLVNFLRPRFGLPKASAWYYTIFSGVPLRELTSHPQPHSSLGPCTNRPCTSAWSAVRTGCLRIAMR